MHSKLSNGVLDRIFDPIGRCLTPAVARKLVKIRAEPEVQAHIAELAEKCNEGELTPEERADYETYVRAIHFLTVLQSKARSVLRRAAKTS